MEENKEIINEVVKEEIKKPVVKKRIPMYVYVIGIVAVLLIVLIVALVVMANGEDDVPVVEQPVVEENVNDKDLTTLTLEDVKKIYKESLPYIDNYVGSVIYQFDKVTMSNANLDFLRAFAFTKINFVDGDLMAPVTVDGSDYCTSYDCSFNGLLTKGNYRFSSSLLHNSSNYYYGVSLIDGDFFENPNYIVRYKDNMYQREVSNLVNNDLSYHYREYMDYEIGEDTLYIKDKYLYITGKLDDRKANYNVVIYGDSTKKKSVGTGVYVVADNLADLIVPNYDRKKVIYKHGFKKAQDGHWYWVSTEQVK